MKKTIYLLAFTFLGLLLTGCNKDDSSDDNDDTSTSNFLKIDDTSYDLVYGIAEDYGYDEDVESYNIDLTLLSVEFAEGEEYTGIYEGIYFEIFSSTANKLEPGTYDYNQSEAAFTFDIGEYFGSDNGEEEEEISEIVSGTITIVDSDNDYYELTFSLVDDMGRTITGHYDNDVDYEEYEEEDLDF